MYLTKSQNGITFGIGHKSGTSKNGWAEIVVYMEQDDAFMEVTLNDDDIREIVESLQITSTAFS